MPTSRNPQSAMAAPSTRAGSRDGFTAGSWQKKRGKRIAMAENTKRAQSGDSDGSAVSGMPEAVRTSRKFATFYSQCSSATAINVFAP